MPHKKILPMLKRLTKIIDNIKKFRNFRKLILKTRFLTHFGKPAMGKGLARELLQVAEPEANILRSDIQTSFVNRFRTVNAIQYRA